MYEALTRLDLTTVGESLKPNMNALWRKFPAAIVGGRRTGYKGSRYELTKHNTWLTRAGGQDWIAGQTPGVPRNIETNFVTISTKGASSTPTQLYLERPRAHRIADLENSAPGHQAELDTVMDLRLAQFFKNARFGAAIDITGAGGRLDTFAVGNTPYKATEDAIRAAGLRQHRKLSGMKLEAVIPEEAASLLAGYEEYNGLIDSGNATTRRPKAIDLDAFVAAYKQRHRLDAVHIVDCIYDSNELGGDENIDWSFDEASIVLVDRRSERYDLTQESSLKPSGGVIVGLSREPGLRTWRDEGREVEFTQYAAEVGFHSPYQEAHTTQMGIRLGNLFT